MYICINGPDSAQNEALEAETSRLQRLMTLETGQNEEKAQGLEQRWVDEGVSSLGWCRRVCSGLGGG